MSAYDRIYLHSVVYHSQALFRIMSDRDENLFDALRLYMISFQRMLMDVGNPLAINKTPRQLISRMYDGYKLKSGDSQAGNYDKFILNWMARIYVRLQFETCMSSMHIVNVLKPEWLYKYYYPLHEASIENALRKINDIFFSKESRESDTVIGFHAEDDPFGFLSNWYLSRFYYPAETHGFTSVEQWLMYNKAKLFKDTDSMKKVMLEIRPDIIKKIGRQVKDFDNSVWASKRYDILLEGLRLKFSQSKELKEKLIGTGDKILVELAANDLIYGVGVSYKDPNALDSSNWRGQNLLGSALMQVREELKGFN